MSYDDTSGNLAEKISWGEVIGSDDGSFTDTGTDKQISAISYAASSTLYLLGLPSQETVTDQSANKTRETRYYYDNLAQGEASKGNLTKEERWKSGANYIDFEKTYDGYGLVTQEKDPRDKQTSYSYDAYNLYPATTTDPLGRTTCREYDYSSGKPKKTIDQNGLVFTTSFDGLDRPLELSQPDLASPSALVAKTTFSYYDQKFPTSVKTVNYLDSSLSAEGYAYFDGIGRLIQERTEAEDANYFSVRDIIYDKQGRVLQESLPYFSTGTTTTQKTANQKLYSVITYDALGRPLAIANAVGTTTIVYDDWTATTTDPNGHPKALAKDAYDRLVGVNELNGASIYSTSYQYDLNNNLTRITDSLGNLRNFTYDGLSRKTFAEDLHASGDTSFGTSTYAYDDAGNLTVYRDANYQEINYAYDDLSRVLTEDYAGAGGTEKAYAYDNCTYGLGRLCSATSSDAVIAYAYNALGLVANETKTAGGASYATAFAYDRQGNRTSIIHPDNYEILYAYNSSGLLETVSKKADGEEDYAYLITDIDYAPTAQASYIAFANGHETTNSFDANALYRLKNKTTTKGGSSNTSATFYPSAGDGYVRKYTTTWSGAHDASSGSSAAYTSSGSYAAMTFYSGGAFYIYRVFFPFNTSALPDNAQIASATLSVYPTAVSDNDNDGDDFISAVKGYEATSSSLATADYEDCGSDNGQPARAKYTPIQEGVDPAGRKDLTSVPTLQYLNFSLNATGTSWINKQGFSFFGLREGHDILNSAIQSTTSNIYSGMMVNYSEYSGTTTDPKLTVVYNVNNAVQNIAYTYDPAGNITKITDSASTSAAKITDYQYDDLNRLLRASTTGAVSGGNYLQTYSYNAIGNITNKSDIGNYTYSGANFANPHAATAINGTNQTYDNNGNLTNDGTWTHSWSYDNRLIQSTRGTTTVRYGYDTDGNRVFISMNGLATTTTVNKYYEVNGATSTKYVYLNDQLVATVEGSTLYYNHQDHLTGSNVITDESGALVETIDYYPFGLIRLDEKTSSFTEKKKFTSHYFDTDTSLNYMNSRYQSGAQGRFLSQDSAFIAVGDSARLKEITKLDLPSYLANPQALNSYSYSYNNPLIYRDSDGNFAFLLPLYCYAQATAPIWAPALVTGISSVGAMITASNLGASVGHLIEGDARSAQNSLNKVNDSLTLTAAGVEGIIVASEMMGAGSQAKIQIDAKQGGEKHNVHGNSLDYKGKVTGYTLRDRDSGQILKFGETNNPGKRYNPKYLNQNKADLLKEIEGAKREIHQWQHDKIIEYKANNNGQRPKLNKSDY